MLKHTILITISELFYVFCNPLKNVDILLMKKIIAGKKNKFINMFTDNHVNHVYMQKV